MYRAADKSSTDKSDTSDAGVLALGWGMDDPRFLELSADYLGDYLGKIRGSLAGLSDEQLWWRPNEASNSIANLLLHLSGNLSQWVLAELGGRAYVRKRDLEFSARDGAGKAALLARLEEVVSGCQQVVRSLPAAQLQARRTIQRRDVDGYEAVYHAVEHMSYHTGQIASMAKGLMGRDLALG
jgi:uncharacterized damage-inducible protein DinB